MRELEMSMDAKEPKFSCKPDLYKIKTVKCMGLFKEHIPPLILSLQDKDSKTS